MEQDTQYEDSNGVKITPFTNLYHKGIEYMVLLNGSQCTVLFSILPLLEWNTNTAVLSMKVREKVRKQINMKQTSFNVVLSNLTSKNFLYRVNNNVYMVNPLLLWYGDEKARKKALKQRDWSISKIV